MRGGLKMRFLAVTAVLIAVVMVAFSSTSHARDQEYEAKQVNLKVDGNLNEWKGSDIINFDQLKDVGDRVPKETDFSGTGMIGWNSSDPDRIYFAATIIDNEFQDIHPAGDTWWEDDSLELMFDFDNDTQLAQWTIGANGKDISAGCTVENLEWIVVNKGNEYIFEGAINPTEDNPYKPGLGVNFQAEVDLIIGLAFHYNDCENGAREHQIGWTPGGAWDANSYGDLIFSSEKAAVEPSGKLTATWGCLKLR
jgi:hypothetical protein